PGISWVFQATIHAAKRMSELHTRKEKRTPVTLKIKFKSATLDQFIERYSVDVSHGGIFIRTKDPLAVGTQLRFEFQLQDASPLISGDGTVVWTREFDPSRVGVAPGMGVRFDRLAAESQAVLDRILAQKGKDGLEPKFDAASPTAEKTKVAPAPLVSGLASRAAETSSPPARAASGSAPSPLPRPAGAPTGGVSAQVRNVPAEPKRTMVGVAAMDVKPAAKGLGLAPPRESF